MLCSCRIFFGSIEVVACLLAVAVAGLRWFDPGHPPFLAPYLTTTAAILSLMVLAVFPVYFQRANASFRDGTIAHGSVRDELQRWSTWHWARTAIAIAAFGSALLAAAL